MKYFVEKNNALIAEFQFPNFIAAFGFMTQVALHCEKLDHHPEWSNVYNRVEIKLRTHDAGNIVTKKDHELAEKIETIFQTYA